MNAQLSIIFTAYKFNMKHHIWNFSWVCRSVQILTAMRGMIQDDVKTIIITILTEGLLLWTVPKIKSRQYLFYTKWKKKITLQNITALINVILLQHTGYAFNFDQGPVILTGTVKIMPVLFTNQITGIFGWGLLYTIARI